MILEYISVLVQSIALLMVIASAFRRRKQRNLFAILIPSGILVLVHAQALWVLEQFASTGNNEFIHLTQTLSLSATKSAIWFLFIFTFAYIVAYFGFRFRRVGPTQPHRLISIHPSHYIFLGAYLLFTGNTLVRTLGGVDLLVGQPGQSIGGQTMLLIFLSIGKLPLLQKILTRQKINFADIIFFAFTFALTLLNSRFLASFILIQLLLVINYLVREVSRRTIVMSATILIGIFIVYGLYRDGAPLNIDSNLASRLANLLERLSSQESPLNWFYRTNVEGFVGLAGLLTYVEQGGNVAHDFGLSLLSVFTQMIPNAWRYSSSLPFANIASFLESWQPVSGSVVASGIENAYGHFGLLGIVALGLLLGILTRYLNANAQSRSSADLLSLILSVQVFNLIRGTFRNALFFGLADLFIYGLFMLIISTRLVFSAQSLQIKIKRYAPRH